MTTTIRVEMDDGVTISGKEFTPNTARVPEWECQMFGCKGMIWMPEKGDAPNWFWRWMQYLCFGHRWIRKEKK